MPLVPAICTQCGAKIQVDPTQKAWLCDSCGTPFITEQAITNYNTTYNTTKVEENTYNVDNSTVVTGNQEVHIHNDEVNKLFLIEDGELTKYNGRKDDVHIPEGVLSIASNVIGSKKINLPSSVVEIKDWAFASPDVQCVRFEPNCKLKKIGKAIISGGYDRCVVIENFPLSVQESEPYAFGKSNLICCLYSKEDFLNAYGENNPMFASEKFSKTGNRVENTNKHIFLFNYKRCVTVNGFKVAIGLNDAVIFAFNGILDEVIKMPSIVEGVPVTAIHGSVFCSIYNSAFLSGVEIKEIHLPKNLLKIPDCERTFDFSYKGFYPTMFIPSSLKKIGELGLMEGFKYVFEKDYSELTYLAETVDFFPENRHVIAPNLSEQKIYELNQKAGKIIDINGGKAFREEKRIYFSSQEEYNAYIKEKKEKAERQAQKELEYERQKYSVSVTVNSKYWKETGRLLIIKDGVQTKLANLPNGNTVKVKVHPTETLVIAPLDKDSEYSKELDYALYVPYGCSECKVVDKLIKGKYEAFPIKLKATKFAPLQKDAAQGRYELLIEDFASSTGNVGYFSVLVKKPNGRKIIADKVYQLKNCVRTMVCEEDEIYIMDCDNSESCELVKSGCNYVAIKKDGDCGGWKIECKRK